jgi:hypothetical protein
MIRKTALALAAALTLAGAAHAGTYAITGSFDTDPTVNVLTGSFSFDDAVVAAGSADDSFSLTALTLSFQGHAFTLADAINAYVQFDAGTLVGPNALFSTLGGGQLELQSFSFFGSDSSNFTFRLATGSEQYGTLGLAAAGTVPEPASYALVLAALGGGLFARRRKA